MGQKVNPIGIRLCIVKKWNSNWYATNKNYARLLNQDINLRKELKKKLSSSFLTSLHKEAKIKQKWPLLNLVRQILHVYKYKMDPIRKADGYTKDGVKKYKRYFLIRKIEESV